MSKQLSEKANGAERQPHDLPREIPEEERPDGQESEKPEIPEEGDGPAEQPEEIGVPPVLPPD